MLARSYLYVPGDNQRFLDKVSSSSADVIILDLEDSVKHENKKRAEEMLQDFLDHTERENLYIRVEPNRLAFIDELINHSKISRIVLPKTESISSISDLNEINKTNKSIHALIESPLGLNNIDEIALSKNVISLGIGEADFYSTIALSQNIHSNLKSFVRSKLVLASAAHGLNPPIAPVSSNFTDASEFLRESEEFLSWGYWGRACIHPAQVEISNSVFVLRDEIKAKAKEILEEIQSASAGAVTDKDGMMIDQAHFRWASRILGI